MHTLMADHGMSERRVCIASGIGRSTLRYRPVPRDDSGVITFIQSHMAPNPRYGFVMRSISHTEYASSAGVLNTFNTFQVFQGRFRSCFSTFRPRLERTDPDLAPDE